MIQQRRTYQQRIFIYFFALFTVFTIAVMIFQVNREKRYKIARLENTLDNITEITHKFILRDGIFMNNNFYLLDSLKAIMSEENVRITVIAKDGVVVYDSSVKDYQNMGNHLDRPEIQKALSFKNGTSIRESGTTNQEYYYYAKFYDHYFIRTAIVYDIRIVHFLRAEMVFLVSLLFMYLIMVALLYFITKRLSEFINRLKDFSIRAGNGEIVQSPEDFPDDELGIISRQIVQIYHKLSDAKDDLDNEKDKLFRHLQALHVGIAFFNPKKEKTLANSHFIQYINLISDVSTITTEHVFQIADFRELVFFIDDQIKNGDFTLTTELPKYETTISHGEQYFHVQAIVFADKSFEILITDVSRLEKRRLMKQQITSNIAHELKTPLASVKGYLETMLSAELPEDKKKHFLQKAFAQTERLTELINDVSLLNNIEDAGQLFEFQTIQIRSLINDVIENMEHRLHDTGINSRINVNESIVINGNEPLLFTVFQNLVENTINYAGHGVTIEIRQYHEDEHHYFFSYSDSGYGIPEEHLPRIFERFYRVDKGRTRKNGGTGLGLAIVKNAVQLHKGEISVRNKPDGGLEFLFSLGK